ncbi:MAG: DNA topoisomerase 4 subunit A [Clostridia bacterium]|nr:DNA topoisomerase 4 subunit A [Clostridia bacterium]
MDKEKGLIFSSLDEVFKTSMISYAEDVILDRALPRVEDGLKPVQRRILFDMYEMGLTSDKPHKKCAKIVGDCLGKYHPHGDSSVYGALVHMAQDFNMRNPLIDGHGNFGTVDGDSAAAYRYTEARLSDISLELLRDIDKETVNFSLNFDDSLKEPDTLPGRFPNLLVNGAMGIAVGLATNIPTHNLGEVINGTVAYLDNPKISLKEMMKYIPAPDFPTGAHIIADDELETAYRTGKGRIKLRARVNIEKDGDKQSLIISEIPYQVNKAELLKKISELKEDKKDILGDIGEVVDESDRNGMRAVVKLKKGADANKILKYLYKNTALETYFGINMVAIAGGKPCQLGLLEILDYYVKYQKEVVLRRSKFDLERAKERAHIIEGLIIAVKNIDEVIKIIKNADNTNDARVKLCQRFSLTDVQATAILDLRLARLNKLETLKLNEELKELKERIAELNEIISNKEKLKQVIKKELLEIKKKYKDERRSVIVQGGKEVESKEDFEDSFKPIEDFVVGITAGKTIKKMTEHNFNGSNKTVKDNAGETDFITSIANVKSNMRIFAFTNLGNVCKLPVDSIPECRFKDKGSKITDCIHDLAKNERVVSIFACESDKINEGSLLFYTKDGLIKKTEWKEYDVAKFFYTAIKLKDGDEVLSVEQDLDNKTICYITEQGMVLNAEKTDIPVQGRVAGGVKGINLNKGDRIVFVSQVDEDGELVIITDGGNYKRVVSSEIDPMTRYRKGVKICDLNSGNKVIFASYVKEPYDIAVVDNFGVVFVVNTEELSIESRTSKGKTLKNENKKRLPEKAYKVN